MKIDTRLVHAGRDPDKNFGVVSPPVYRASTIIFRSMAEFENRAERKYTGFSYGLSGTPTTMALAETLAEISGGARGIPTSSGLSAVTQTLTSLLKAGDHVLLPDTCYGPTRVFGTAVLPRFGVDVQFYDPQIGKGIAALLKPTTRVVYCESPGTATFEVQDVPAIAEVAHARGALLVLDNTWGSPINFRSFEHGVDIEVQAGTKFLAGHSDLLMGSIVTRTDELFRTVKDGVSAFGDGIAPDVCYEVMRGIRTLGVRMRQLEASALEIARWLETRPEVARVLHPALPKHPGHEIWKRDFRGSSSLFGVVLKSTHAPAIAAMLDGMRLFRIGASFGGFESLITPPRPERTATRWQPDGYLLRMHVGLEAVDDLIADLEAGFKRLGTAA